MILKVALYTLHRWLGIAMCWFFALWFASGIVMMYVEYPQLTEQERLDTLPYLNIGAANYLPFAASKSVLGDNAFKTVKLTTVLGRPTYEFVGLSGAISLVFADTNERLQGVDRELAVAAAKQSGFSSPGSAPTFDATLDFDQWTLSAELNKYRPLHKISLNDEAATVLYIASTTGQVARDTNRSERFWNWLGSTIHWIYPAMLRKNASLWNNVVVYVSLLGIASVISGAVIGFLRLRFLKPYSGNRVSPYKRWMKWHHIGGLLTLVFVSTYIFSGLMSMGPWGMFDSPNALGPQVNRYRGADTLRLSDLALPNITPSDSPIKEIHWHQILGQTYASIVMSASEKQPVFNNTDTDPAKLLSQNILDAVTQLIPGAQITSLELISAPDNYYYSLHNRYRPFPVYRAIFNDSEDSWFHIDGINGEVLNRVDDAARRERWFFNGLHSLDFQFLLQRRPLWDIIVISLNLLGFAFSITAVVIGWRRLAHTLPKGLD